MRPLRIGITGHTDLGRETVRLVDAALGEHLTRLRKDSAEPSRPLVGVSCLAPGADCVFADVVLRLGGTLEVILPWPDYPGTQTSAQHTAVLGELVQQAASVRDAGRQTGRRAFAAANDLMLDSVDQLVAVWNGVSCSGIGGTAHALSTARARRMPVAVIWPEGSRRGTELTDIDRPPGTRPPGTQAADR
jgi:hypothetical protein